MVRVAAYGESKRLLEVDQIKNVILTMRERIELMEQGEHDMPVGGVEEIGALAFDPPGLSQRLAPASGAWW